MKTMPPIRLLILLFVLAAAAKQGGCDHVNELGLVQLDMDRPVDKFNLNAATESGNCTEADLSVIMPRNGVTDVVGIDKDRAFAISLRGALYEYNGGQWEKMYSSVFADGYEAGDFDYLGVSLSEKQDQLYWFGSGSYPFSGDNWGAGLLEYESLGHGDNPVPPDILINDARQGRAWYASAIGIWGRDYVLAGGHVTGKQDSNPADLKEDLENTLSSGALLSVCRGEDNYCPTPANAPDIPLVDAWGGSTSDFYLVGNRMDHSALCHQVVGEIYHCNRNQCLLEATVQGAFLRTIWGASKDALFVVGGLPAFGNAPGRSVVLKRNHNTWTRINTDTQIPLNGVWGNENDLFVVGGFHPDNGVPTSIAMHYDGAKWTQLDVGANAPLHGVWGSSPSDVHMVGEEGFFHYPVEPSLINPWTEQTYLCEDYCSMETRCIPKCMCDAEDFCPCENEYDNCFSECLEWLGRHLSDVACEPGIRAWVTCINRATCDDVETFFKGHPDDVASNDPCGAEYHAMDCMDFEPRTEYGF